MSHMPAFGRRNHAHQVFDPYSHHAHHQVPDPFAHHNEVWDPFHEFYLETPRSVIAPAPSFHHAPAAMAQIEYKETPEAHIFRANLHGYKKEEVKIQVEDDRVLKITGEKRMRKEDNHDNWHHYDPVPRSRPGQSGILRPVDRPPRTTSKVTPTMRLYSILLLAAAALLAHVDTTTAYVDKLPVADYPVAIRSVTDIENGIPSKRLLRRFDEDDEERGNPFNNLSETVKATATKIKLEGYLLVNANGRQMLDNLQFSNNAVAAVASSKFEQMITYVSMFNSKNRDSPISLIKTLTSRYGDDAMAKALVTAERNKDSPAVLKEQVKALRQDQLNAWLKEGNTIDQVYSKLKLGQDEWAVFKNQKLEVLEDYIKKHNENSDVYQSLLQTLTKGFGGEDKLVSAIAIAKTDRLSTAPKKAREVESALLTKWTDLDWSLQRVFENLKLQQNVDNVLSSDRWRTFNKYFEAFSKKHPDNEVSLLKVLTTTFGDVPVAKALASGKESLSTSRQATKLQSEQLKGWLDGGKSVDAVFGYLHFDTTTIGGVISRNVDTLDEYIKLFNTQNSGRATLKEVMAKGFGGETKVEQLLNVAKNYPKMSARATKVEKLLNGGA